MKYLYQKILTAALIMSGGCLSLEAVRALPHPVEYVQPDGSTIQVVINGDEHCRWYTSASGELLMPLADGKLVTADTGYAASLQQRRLVPRSNAPGSYTTFPTVGEQNALIILVEFTDRPFTVTRDDFEEMMTYPGYSKYNAAGSARDYFIENSAGRFMPVFDVYGPVRLARETAYYGGGQNDDNAYQMVAEACRALDGDIDFSRYDRDGDGWVDNVYIFYSGQGEADGGGANTVWPHSSNIYNKGERLNLDGVQIGQYACSNELVGMTSRMVGIGTFCHEFSHVLGLPDLYSTNGNSAYTPQTYSLMDHGNYNNDGRCPCALTAYERYFLGWCEPIELAGEGTVRIEPIASNMAYRISVPGSEEEYYLLENRQLQGWDSGIPGHGMLLWHIEYDKRYWDSNTVNNDESRQRVDLIEADGMTGVNTITGDSFPGTDKIAEFDGFAPRSGTQLPHRLTSIAESDGIITLNFNAPSAIPATPTGVSASDVEDNFFTAVWDAVENVDSYMLSVTSSENQRPRPVATATLKKVDDSTRVIVEGLEPETAYTLSVAARKGNTIGQFNTPVKFTTAEPGITYRAVEALEAEEVGKDSFLARWQPLEGAESYQVDVWEILSVAGNSDVASFTSPLTLPEGWTTSAASTMSVAGYYGQAAPSLRFTQNAEMLQTPIYDNEIKSFSFWMRGYKADPQAAIQVYARTDGDWKPIDTLTGIDNSSATTVTCNEAQLSGANGIKIVYQAGASAGSVCIDDVTVGFGTVKEESPVLTAAPADGTSLWVESLNPDSDYRYVVYGVKGDRRSMPSNPIYVHTKPGDGIADIDSDITVSVHYGILTVNGGTAAEVFDLAGRRIASFATPGSMALPAGIYIVRCGGRTYKISVI